MPDLDLVSRANTSYVEERYRRYQADPHSVGFDGALFFAGLEMEVSGNGCTIVWSR